MAATVMLSWLKGLLDIISPRTRGVLSLSAGICTNDIESTMMYCCNKVASDLATLITNQAAFTSF